MKKSPSARSSSPAIALPLTLRKLIRSTTTTAFLKKNGSWTRDIGIAEVFGDYLAILDAKARFDLRDVELYYSFHSLRTSPWDFATPI